MVTHWHTDPMPSMDNPLTRPSAQGLHRPQVFVRVEFGVSWSAQHHPRRHGYEFKSRALRERPSNFPRTVPAPTTNYLATPSIRQLPENQAPQIHFHLPPQEQPLPRRQEEIQQTPNFEATYLPPAPYHTTERGQSRQMEAVPEPPPLGPFTSAEHRQARADRSASPADRHERGSSAPPPLSENNWDVVQPQTMGQTSAEASTAHTAAHQHRTDSDVWKDLPEVPSRFRLGEDGMPWEGTWQFPLGFEPFLEPDPYLRPSSSVTSSRPSSDHTGERPRTPEQRSRPIPEFSPQSPPRGDDHARRHELEALGHAMMTVDNGFENQWWNQGERNHLAAVAPPPATRQQMEEQMALGWVGALLPAAGPGEDSNRHFTPPRPEAQSIVSPESSLGPEGSNVVVSPVSTFSMPTQLGRTLSTRSDELWFGRDRGAVRYA